MDQELALEIMLDGHNVMLSGPAGSGKTYVLNQFIKLARGYGKSVAITATTGLAATHINGSTIHAWSGIGVLDFLPAKFYENLSKNRIEQIEKADILVIDEISMLHDFRLDMIDEITRSLRKNDKPFGGLQVILCGDFFQLPPVNRTGREQSGFVVNSAAYKNARVLVCYLNQQYRQDDDNYLDILNSIRANDLRRKHVDALLARRGIELQDITELHTTNIDVDDINNARLAEVEGDEYAYEMLATGSSGYVESLKKSCLANEVLKLKKSALVMCIRNNPEKKYVNGSLGVVEGFEKLTNYPIVRLKNGRQVTILPETWELRDGDKKRASITQIPLRLAWAITIHKSQGMTLDGAKIDLSKAFVEGMGYVALSRVKNLDSLSLVGINSTALKISKQALEIDKVFKDQTLANAEDYQHLRQKAKERAKKPKSPTKKLDSSWANKLEKMRGKYPNAYRPWSENDDKKLVELFTKNNQISVDELTAKFGRHPGSIRSRLKKHFGEDSIS